MPSPNEKAEIVATEVVSKDRNFRETLAFILNIMFWVIFVTTFVVDFQERNNNTPDQILTEVSFEEGTDWTQAGP